MMTRQLKWGAVSLFSVGIVPSTVIAITYCTVFNSGLVTNILNGFDPCGFYANTFSDAIEQCGDETFQVAGPAGAQVQCDFCFWAEFAAFENEGGLVALDEIPVLPGNPGFRNAALTAPSSTIIFRGLGAGNDEPGATTTLTLDANRTYIFWLVQNNTRAAALANPNIAVFFSVVGANFDNFDHLNSLTSAQNGGATAFAWEDLTGGGDQDFSDQVFTSRCEFIGTPLIEKRLLEGPEQIGIYLPVPTQYVFEIAYSNGAPVTPVRIIDTVPAEFEILVLSPTAGAAIFFDPSRGAGNSANRIEWDLPAGTTSASLDVTMQTVASPGRGHRTSLFKPTSCGPLPINDGATAFEVDPATGEIVLVEVVDPVTGEITLEPVVIAGPSNSLEVEAVEGAKPCVE